MKKFSFLLFGLFVGCSGGVLGTSAVLDAVEAPRVVYEADPSRLCVAANAFGCYVDCAMEHGAWRGEPHGAWRVTAERTDACSYGFAVTAQGYLVGDKDKIPEGSEIVGIQVQ